MFRILHARSIQSDAVKYSWFNGCGGLNPPSFSWAVIICSSINDVGVGYNSPIKATLVAQSCQHVLTVRIGLHQLLVSITTFVPESL